MCRSRFLLEGSWEIIIFVNICLFYFILFYFIYLFLFNPTNSSHTMTFPFGLISLGKIWTLLLIIKSSAFLKGLLWHLRTHEGWDAINKKKKKRKKKEQSTVRGSPWKSNQSLDFTQYQNLDPLSEDNSFSTSTMTTTVMTTIIFFTSFFSTFFLFLFFSFFFFTTRPHFR